MKTYKVVKTTDIFEKGDVFTKNNDGTYTCELTEKCNNRKYTTAITISAGYMAEALLQGIIEIMDTEKVQSNNECAKCKSLCTKLDELTDTYQTDLDVTQIKYNAGDLSEMQRAEAVTVLSNLIKLTNHIKSILNGSN